MESEPERIWVEFEKLAMKIEVATIVKKFEISVVEDADGSLVLIRSVGDYNKIKDEELKDMYISRVILLHDFENRLIEEAHQYRDDAVYHLRKHNWERVLNYLQNAAFHEEDCGQPYAVTFLPLLEELERLLAVVGLSIPSRSIMLNRVCNKH